VQQDAPTLPIDCETQSLTVKSQSGLCGLCEILLRDAQLLACGWHVRLAYAAHAMRVLVNPLFYCLDIILEVFDSKFLTAPTRPYLTGQPACSMAF
jgi:hypothetical protein